MHKACDERRIRVSGGLHGGTLYGPVSHNERFAEEKSTPGVASAEGRGACGSFCENPRALPIKSANTMGGERLLISCLQRPQTKAQLLNCRQPGLRKLDLLWLLHRGVTGVHHDSIARCEPRNNFDRGAVIVPHGYLPCVNDILRIDNLDRCAVDLKFSASPGTKTDVTVRGRSKVTVAYIPGRSAPSLFSTSTSVRSVRV